MKRIVLIVSLDLDLRWKPTRWQNPGTYLRWGGIVWGPLCIGVGVYDPEQAS